jgi:hypothetical protein
MNHSLASQRGAMLDHALARYRSIVGLRHIECDLPSDVWRESHKIGRNNGTRFERESRAAHVTLQPVRAAMKSASTEELARSLITGRGLDDIAAAGVAYLVYRDGNQLITDQLAARGKDAAAALQRAHEPTDLLFTGSAGPVVRISQLVELINEGRGAYPW